MASYMSPSRVTRFDAGIFLVSFAVLLTELLLTRIFSVTMFFHLSFMVVSLAMLGFGASGLAVNLLPHRFPEAALSRQAGLAAWLFALTSVAAIGISFQLRVSLESSLANWLRISVTYVVCAAPFFFGGLVVSLILTHRSAQSNRLYFFDLAGAALGCVALIPATNWLGAPSAVLLASAMASAAMAVFGLGIDRRQVRLGLWGAVVLLVASALNTTMHFYDVRFVKGSKQPPMLALRWNSFSRVDVEGTPSSLWTPHPPRSAGYSSRLDPDVETPEGVLRYDAEAATQLTYFDGNLQRVAYLGSDVSSSPYHLRKFRNVLVIGPGGGRDVLTALTMGSGPVTGVEINPITVELMRTRFRTFSGGLYAGYPGVNIVNDDGRSFLRHGRKRYDLIEASLVDTWAASAAGAHALTENNLYTVDAFGDYLDHLTPDGVICFNRWFADPPVESLRVVSLAREALLRRGAVDPAAHVMVVRTDPSETLQPSLGSILIKASPFTAAEVTALRRFAADMGFVLVYAPDGTGRDPSFRALLGPDGAGFVASYPYDVSAVSDDRPFFFSRVPVLAWIGHHLGIHKSSVGSAPLGLGGQTLLISAVATAVATGLLLLLPYWVGRRRAAARPAGAAQRGLRWALYFAGLGLGFIFIEIVLVQRFSLFLGYPVYSLSVVLFTILLASAVGSLLSGRFTSGRALPRALGALVALLLLYGVGLPPLLAAARGTPIAARIALAVVTIAPLGLLMGVPFASGVRRAGRESTELVSWAWAVNGGASVMGSTLTVLISMTYGFTASFVAGALAYAAALAVVLALPEKAAP